MVAFKSWGGNFDDVSVLVLAGGRGTRIQKIYPSIPKPMVPIKGRPFLFWLTGYLSGFGLNHFVYSIGYRGKEIEDWISEDVFPHITRVSRLEATPLGTGGAVLNCLDLCREWTVVVNGDGLCTSGLPQLLHLRHAENRDGGLIGLHVEDTGRFGSLSLDRNGILTEFREKVPGTGYINCGIYLFRTEVLRRLVHLKLSGQDNCLISMERDIVPHLIAEGCRISVVKLEQAAFIDIGTPESLAEAEHFVEKHLLAGSGYDSCRKDL